MNFVDHFTLSQWAIVAVALGFNALVLGLGMTSIFSGRPQRPLLALGGAPLPVGRPARAAG
jgi:hypothetical protein